MLFKRKRDWDLPESAATQEKHYIDRRRILAGLGLGGAILAAPAVLRMAGGDSADVASEAPPEIDPSAGRYPVPRNATYTVARALTAEKDATTYNNFYEFGSHKSIHRAAQKLPIRPWEIRIDGMVEAPLTVGFDELLAKMPLEERIYRHRCVEAWAMTVPWSGFPLKALVDFARPLGSAKYLAMETFENAAVAPGQNQAWYPWPYQEGLAIEEATNDLAFIATGIYGKPLPKQNGAPLRLAVPWKYGFKSVKSLVRFTFTEQRPKSFWERLQASEYGFWANVNPEVPHRRWSQARERLLGTGERVPTRIYNGYGEFVAGLYTDRKGERLYM